MTGIEDGSTGMDGSADWILWGGLVVSQGFACIGALIWSLWRSQLGHKHQAPLHTLLY